MLRRYTALLSPQPVEEAAAAPATLVTAPALPGP
jgi:hypothetical protein